MPALVIDSSVAVTWCFPDELTDYTTAILQRISEPLAVIASRLWAYEVRNSVLVGLRRQRIGQAHAESFLDSLQALPITLTDPPSYDGVFTLAQRLSLTVYDAAYLDLALREDLPLATLDNSLIRAAGQSGVAIFQP